MSDWFNGWPAPAKLNLLLRITGRRDDGYHLLQTVFQFVQQADLIDFRVRDDVVIHRVTELEGVPAESDLMVKAARLLQQQTQSSKGVDIRVHKQLPMGGGLGGGSVWLRRARRFFAPLLLDMADNLRSARLSSSFTIQIQFSEIRSEGEGSLHSSNFDE